MDAPKQPDLDASAIVHPFRRAQQDAEPDDGRFPPFEGQPTASAPKIPEILWHGDADPHADRPWLVRDLVPETGKGLISGQWGAGKTFGALDLSASVMTLTKFANRRTERQGGVLFIAPEGAFEIPIRLRGLIEGKLTQARAMTGQPTSLDRLPFAWIEECPRLVERSALATLLTVGNEVRDRLRQEFDLPLVLIIIDTIAAGAGFNDENSAAETQKVMDAMQALSRETGAFVMGVDHFGKTSETGTRGSSAKEGAADTVLAFLANRDEAGNVSNTRMAVRKLRGGRIGMETPYTLDVVQIGESSNREPVTTCVVNWQDREHGNAPAPPARNPWPKKLQLFRTALEATVASRGKRIRPFGSEGAEQVAAEAAMVRAEFVARYPAAASDTDAKRSDAKRKAFDRAVLVATESGLIGCCEMSGFDHYWIIANVP
ncbi:AAA family ATPase [Methylobacterium sp. J-030]|uniref:ATP-binding protein n=1 Tax=Methylobacterium sp. J-030 TaxID=2836627 RepID=UPI001FBB15ED|nr:AAA family ATPase [Methylobacterium sp. J-030]MCJ2069341.1 AAA family ATPase [Methylobacterium sp. J-030]